MANERSRRNHQVNLSLLVKRPRAPPKRLLVPLGRSRTNLKTRNLGSVPKSVFDGDRPTGGLGPAASRGSYGTTPTGAFGRRRPIIGASRRGMPGSWQPSLVLARCAARPHHGLRGTSRPILGYYQQLQKFQSLLAPRRRRLSGGSPDIPKVRRAAYPDAAKAAFQGDYMRRE